MGRCGYDAVDFGLGWDAVIKDKCCVPRRCNHAVGACIRIKFSADGNEGVDVPAKRHANDCVAVSIRAHLPDGAGHSCIFDREPAQQRAQKR